MEKATAASSFFETYYKEILGDRQSPRELRLEALRYQMDENPALSPDDRLEIESTFFRQETDHLRQTRVLKYESLKAASGQRDDGYGPCAKLYRTIKILGKGSFGVVRLVKERQAMGATNQPRQVFAMKVIKKTEMIRSCQEGHLRAERDFLIASDNSDWYEPRNCG